jgi:hypothetical protein
MSDPLVAFDLLPDPLWLADDCDLEVRELPDSFSSSLPDFLFRPLFDEDPELLREECSSLEG